MSNPNQGENLVLRSDAQAQPQSGQEGVMPAFINDSSHPMVALLHVVLKIAIVFLYLVLPLISKGSFSQLVIVIILAAVDFWIVKNVAGRLLVGLRWWIDFDENG